MSDVGLQVVSGSLEMSLNSRYIWYIVVLYVWLWARQSRSWCGLIMAYYRRYIMLSIFSNVYTIIHSSLLLGVGPDALRIIIIDFEISIQVYVIDFVLLYKLYHTIFALDSLRDNYLSDFVERHWNSFRVGGTLRCFLLSLKISPTQISA